MLLISHSLTLFSFLFVSYPFSVNLKDKSALTNTSTMRFLNQAQVGGKKMGVSQNEGYYLGVPIIRSVVFWGLYWGPPILGNYQIDTKP